MIPCKDFYNLLIQYDIDFFTGVPDSTLKDFCSYVFDHTTEEQNIIAANEGNAIALAAGYYLATNKIGLVYMQNSGLGNAINPLTSLVDPEVYNIPVLLMVGWRGEPGKKDEPQHLKQGKITVDLLSTLGIPYYIIPDDFIRAKAIVENILRTLQQTHIPNALVVTKGVFEKYSIQKRNSNPFKMTREEVIKKIVDSLDDNAIIISTTGMTSRELFEYRGALNQGHQKDFLTVGSMGHASQIALTIALNKKDRPVYCIDGDGAVIMHMGALAVIGSQGPENIKHIVINNGAHDSVGGQPTAGFHIDIPSICRACGYKAVFSTDSSDQLPEILENIKKLHGPVLLEIKIKKGARKDLGRPTNTPIQNKINFMKFLAE